MQEIGTFHDPETLLRLKDTIVTCFRQLPSEHQATIGLVLLNDVMSGEWGTWVTDAIATRHGVDSQLITEPVLLKPLEIEDLSAMKIAEEDIRALSADDLSLITRRVQQHLTLDVLADEVRFATEQVLEEKRAKDHNHTNIHEP
ncbi:MAG: hypothetical protein IT322_11885 [Anaerolineae bacterium]|nr:hypothetical protein [Anaerolineae bacterium]